MRFSFGLLASLSLPTLIAGAGSGQGQGLTQGNQGQGSGSDNMIICHVPAGNPGNAHTIEIDPSAWPAHRDNHGGDTRGPCLNNGAVGDPHFLTWDSRHYDYHGICDLVLVSNDEFRNGIGMDIHIRSRPIKKFSEFRPFTYIASAAIRIGSDTLEVSADIGNQKQFWINGIPGDVDIQDNTLLEETLFGYPIKFSSKSERNSEYAVYLENNQILVISTHNDYVRIDIVHPTEADFKNAVGMLGKFPTGEFVGRDKVTRYTKRNINDFGQEWQVLNTEINLFRNAEGPQHPYQQCQVTEKADVKEMRRRLGELMVSDEEAEDLCSHIEQTDYKQLCIMDVVATGDKEIAGAY